MKTQKFRIVKFYYGEEINQVNLKTYLTKEDANNAGNSWKRDSTVHADISKGKWFEVVSF